MQEEKHTLSEVFKSGLAAYLDSGKKISQKQWKVVNNIMRCHTPDLGGHIYRCDSCGSTELHYNSCRDRHCPACQSLARAAWIQKRSEELLPIGYFHVVFTLPQELNLIAHYNKSTFYSLFFSSVSTTLLTLAKDPKWFGGTIGITSILHTWGQTLIDHPHIHCIVSGGGVRNDNKKWKSFRANYLFPIKVMSLLFRRIFLEQLREMLKHPDFVRPLTMTIAELNQIINGLGKKNWVVYAKEPFTSAVNVIKYLGNYTHRIALSQSRIIKIDKDNVWFRYKDHADNGKQKIMKLSIIEFIRRYLLHVLPDRFVRIRYFGFLSNRNRTESIRRCMKLLGKKYESTHLIITAKELIKKLYNVDISACKNCEQGHYIMYRSLKPRGREKYFAHTASGVVKYRESTSFNTQSMPLLKLVL